MNRQKLGHAEPHPFGDELAITRCAGLIDGRGQFGAAAVLLLITFAAYVPALECGTIWDDDAYVLANPTLRSMDGLRQIWFQVDATPQYYPMVHTSYWLEYRLWGLAPAGYHLINILLHGISGVLVWKVLRMVGLGSVAAWVAAAVFSLHPVHVESVAWITERKNVLSGVFYLAAAIMYLRFAGRRENDSEGDRYRWTWYAGSLMLFLCALLSKTVTCSLPAALLLVIWSKRKRVARSDVIALSPFFAIGITLGLLTLWLEKQVVGAKGPAWDLSLVERCLIAGRGVWFYLGRLIWPSQLTFIYPRWQIDIGSLGFPAAAALLVVVLWRARGPHRPRATRRAPVLRRHAGTRPRLL